jgi:hypothetical protein
VSNSMDPVVVVALEELSRMVDVRAAHPVSQDKRAAVEAFRLLWHNGHSLAPAQIEDWALEHGWTRDGASGLGEIAALVRQGHRFLLAPGPPVWSSDSLGRWTTVASRRTTDVLSPSTHP